MEYVINQARGIGDILFIEPILKYLYDNGKNKIILPTVPEYMWIKEYIDYVEFPSIYDFNMDYDKFDFGIINGKQNYIPMRFAMPIVRGLAPHDYSDLYHTMLDKYRLLNLDTNLWKTLKWKRNIIKEDELYNKLVKTNDYILVNTFFSGGKVNPSLNTGKEIIKMDYIPGYTLLDWAKIIENASEIHSVSTSTLFMFETLIIKASSVHIYNRTPIDKNLDGIREYVNKNFILHE